MRDFQLRRLERLCDYYENLSEDHALSTTIRGMCRELVSALKRDIINACVVCEGTGHNLGIPCSRCDHTGTVNEH